MPQDQQLLPQDRPLPRSASQPTPTLPDEPQKELASLPVQPGGAPIQDANGTALSLPAGSLPEGQSASLVSVQLASQTLKKLGEGYRVDTPAYSISVGKSDAQGSASTQFYRQIRSRPGRGADRWPVFGCAG